MLPLNEWIIRTPNARYFDVTSLLVLGCQRTMSEIRMRLKTFAISSATIFCILLYLLLKSPDCPVNPTPIAPSYQQVAVSNNKVNKTIQPFTVYCITPTYARPVQKAELTRFVPFSNFLFCKRCRDMNYPFHLNNISVELPKLFNWCRSSIGSSLKMPKKPQA